MLHCSMMANTIIIYFHETGNFRRYISMYILAFFCFFTPNVLAANTVNEELRKVIVDSISKCWNIDTNNRTNVTVRIHLDRNGKALREFGIYLIDASAGSKEQVLDAYNSARRSIFRCQKDGFDLPVNDYEHWKTIEILFDNSNIFR